jgi:hypothetical protein
MTVRTKIAMTIEYSLAAEEKILFSFISFLSMQKESIG